MPEISRFFGIVICMFANEHSPAHFHAYYQDFEMLVEIETGIVDGRFPPRQLKSVLDWCELYRDELMENWNIAVAHGKLNKITPLK